MRKGFKKIFRRDIFLVRLYVALSTEAHCMSLALEDTAWHVSSNPLSGLLSLNVQLSLNVVMDHRGINAFHFSLATLLKMVNKFSYHN